ncbi:MAG: hypothetical protein SFU83_19805 [Meiothermus sp.]|nr:hypothetical protein [Meiothermus sp.]
MNGYYKAYYKPSPLPPYMVQLRFKPTPVVVKWAYSAEDIDPWDWSRGYASDKFKTGETLGPRPFPPRDTENVGEAYTLPNPVQDEPIWILDDRKKAEWTDVDTKAVSPTPEDSDFLYPRLARLHPYYFPAKAFEGSVLQEFVGIWSLSKPAPGGEYSGALRQRILEAAERVGLLNPTGDYFKFEFGVEGKWQWAGDHLNLWVIQAQRLTKWVQLLTWLNFVEELKSPSHLEHLDEIAAGKWYSGYRQWFEDSRSEPKRGESWQFVEFDPTEQIVIEKLARDVKAVLAKEARQNSADSEGHKQRQAETLQPEKVGQINGGGEGQNTGDKKERRLFRSPLARLRFEISRMLETNWVFDKRCRIEISTLDGGLEAVCPPHLWAYRELSLLYADALGKVCPCGQPFVSREGYCSNPCKRRYQTRRYRANKAAKKTTDQIPTTAPKTS